MAVKEALFSVEVFFLFQECEKKEQMINKVKYKNRSSFVSVPRDCDLAMAVAITQWRGNAPECPLTRIVLKTPKVKQCLGASHLLVELG